ncbi:NmrA family NAD(P)-binding protein [Ewingella americana]|uniref:NmrA family NAD(P)-binding protein n=1 Tax=Ewingella americana TaxID=41202 RepID=UPI00163A101A|nr:NmrA family NAD(P)-binding protein [Ewingella americana]QMV51471.1 NmrA family NAD(P)-binding protein [Ewingella americana]
MYVITGITGKVGGAVARTLLSKNLPVRGVMRDVSKADKWRALGCEVAIAEMDDAKALTEAFKGATGVFILPPSDFDPAPGFPAARIIIEAIVTAISAASPEKVVCLSTIGAQAAQTNLLTQRTLLEQALNALTLPVTFLRPGWFMENCALDVASARDTGVIHSYLQPLDKAVPMIATADVGKLAATLLQQRWQGQRVVELEGPHRVSPNDIANTFAQILGRPVVAELVERHTWEAVFRAQGHQHPSPRMQMIDGFNQEWICFEGPKSERVIGETELDEVLRKLLEA